MFKVLLIIIVILAIFLCFIVTIQNSKGGGLAAGFASSNQIMGVRKTTDFLEKATWGLAIIMVVLSVVSAAFVTRTTAEEQPLTAPITTQTDANNVQSFPAATQQQAPAQNTSDKEAQAPAETPAPAPAE